MAKEYHLQLPVSEETIRALRMGDIVYFSGVVHTLRDMGHRRAVDLAESGKLHEIPFQTLKEGALWHCGPIVKYLEGEQQWIVKSAGSTTSSRFSPLGAKLIEHLKIRLTIGKGTMTRVAHEAMQKTGSVFLNTTGGCAALYARQIEEVEAVFWTEMGLPEACWVMRMKEFGPLIVGIDSLGNSLFESVKSELKARLEESYAEFDLKDQYAYVPKRVPSGTIR